MHSLIVPVLNTVDPLCVGLIHRIWGCEAPGYMNWLVDQLDGVDHFYMVRIADRDLSGPLCVGDIDDLSTNHLIDLAVDVQHEDLSRTYMLCTSQSVPSFANVDVVEHALAAIDGDSEDPTLRPSPDDATDPQTVESLLRSAFESGSTQVTFYLPRHPAIPGDGPFSMVASCYSPDILTVTLMYGVARLARRLGGGIAITGDPDRHWAFTGSGITEVSADAAQAAMTNYGSP